MEHNISVIIPTFSRPKMLGRAIESVLNQEYDKYEILVIDDNGIGSENQVNTEKFLEKYKENSKVKYIKHESNLGGNAARNTGIKNAKGDFVGFLDDDDEWNSKFLRNMIKLFINNEIGAVYCGYYINDNGKTYYSSQGNKQYTDNVFQRLLKGWCPTSTSLFIVRKECFEKVGYFDESLISFQDYDMWLRISQKYLFNSTKDRLVVKYEQHGGEQVGFNPYNRRIAWNDLKVKWENRLNEKDKKYFSSFLEIHDINIKRNLIIYSKQKNIKTNYFKLYTNFLNTNAKLREKVLLLLVCMFGLRILTIRDRINMKVLGRYKVVNSHS